MNYQQDNLEIRSEEVQEILGTPPAWLTRYGTLVAMAAIILLGWIGYLIKYPDVVSGAIRITSVDPPRKVVAENASFISDILIHNEDTITKGQTLMVYRSKANFGDVLVLEDKVSNIKSLDDSTLLAFSPDRDLILGELDDALYNFLEKKEELLAVTSGKFSNLGIDQLERQIRRAQSSIQYERRRKESLEKELELVRQRYIREQNLDNSGRSDISKVRQMEEEVLNYERMIQGSESSVKTRQIEIQMYEREISGVKSGSSASREGALNNLRESFINLQKRIDAWKKEFLVVASAPGVVYLTNDEVQKQQYVRAGTELMVILPTNTSGIIGKINLAPNGSGKVRAGQKVVVKFDSYPFPEFGAVFGEVFKKGKSLTGEEVPIDVVFPKGLITTTGNKLEPSQGMTGKVEIITEEKRFLEWIFERFRKVSVR
ncbi:MAG TPA: HlyD family efflux transporter periplasmic adaptor subunit [Flavilitoribacter sp.]|nr:HlyD family efflux transporter periplasmic adaptor subunit [Flavilitoribacter sp.]